jgi:sec-independent protein translocase protein TatB
MFDIDGGKLLIIGIVALVVIGPKELPGVLRQVGQAVAKLRRMAAEFQGQFMDAMRESELDQLRKDVTKMATVDMDGINPLDAMRKDLAATQADIESALDTRIHEPAPSPASVDLSGLPSGDVNGSTVAAEGIAPVAAPQGPSPEGPLAEPSPEPIAVPRTAGGQNA